MIFRQLFDSVSSTYSYLVASRHGGEALIIDPVLEQVDRLRPIANIVRYSHPTSEEEAGMQRLPAGSRIICVVCDYDLLTNHPKKKLSSRDALEEMGLERGKLYDSIVLRTLSQVVESQARARRRPEREISQKARVLEEEELKESLEEIFREEE